MPPGVGLPELEVGHQGHPAAHGVAHDHQVVQVLAADEVGHHLGLVGHGIMAVGGLVRQAEAFQLHGEDPVLRGQGRDQVPPGVGLAPEAVQQQEGRPLAGSHNN